MVTWTEINAKLDVFLDDPLEQNEDLTYKVQTYDRRLRLDSWNWVLDVLVLHTPRQRRITLTVDSTSREAVLPEDFYGLEGIYDATEECWWTPMEHRPGYYQATDEEALEYWVWDRRLYLQDAVDRELELYYWAYWPKIVYEVGANIGRPNAPVYAITYQDEEIYTPKWAELPLIHLTCAHCLIPGAIEASDINNWRVWIDAGNPEHNPRMQQASYHLRWHDDLMSKVPPAYRRRNTWQ